MKKLTIIFLVLLFALSALTGTVSATPVDQLTGSATYVPADALFYGVIRADDGFIETLDGLLAMVLDKFPEGMIPPDANVSALLDESVRDFTDKPADTFAGTIRPWLGDTVSMTITSGDALRTRNPVTWIIDVANRDAAAVFLQFELVEDSGGFPYYSVTELPDGTLVYESEFSIDPTVMLFEDILLIGDLETGINTLPGLIADGDSLSDSDDFAAALAALPGDDYNAVGYLNTETLLDAISDELAEVEEMALFNLDMLQVGQVAFGFTIMQGRSLVIDAANTGGAMTMQYPPLNLDLLDLLSAQTTFVVQGNSLGNQVQALFDGLYEADAMLKEQGVMPMDDAPGFLADFGTDDLATFLRLSIEGTYQIDLDETLAWMNGDYLLFAGVRPDETSATGVLPEGGFFVTTDNPEATARFVENSVRVIADIFAPTTWEDGVGTIPLGAFFSMPEVGNLIYTSNDDMLMLGMSDSVNFALEPGEITLRDTANYAYESQFFLDDPFSLFYADLAPIREAVASLMQSGMIPMSPEEADILDVLLSIVDTASFTASMVDGNAHMRLTLTLGE